MIQGAIFLLVLAFVAAQATEDGGSYGGSRLPQFGSRASLKSYAYHSLWLDFKKTYNKSYATTEEEQRRFEIFVKNQRKIDDHNALFRIGRKTFEMGLNQFSDMTHEEFRSSRGNCYRRDLRDDSAPRGSTFHVPDNVQLPLKVDWRKKGYVTRVKDQGACGSCWAFSAVAALEGQHYRKNKTLVEFSEQNLVDCSWSFSNHGCSGGFVNNAFKYVKSNKGIDTERAYQYEAKEGPCRFKKQEVGAEITGYTGIPAGNETALTIALATQGPIAVGIDASHPSFMQYKKGVYYEPMCSPSDLDHAVLAVGYGTTSEGEKYYIVKNSWGTSWGEDGYILMARGRKNNCGIASDASYPNM